MAKAIPDQVNNDEEYNELLKRITDAAVVIGDPLIDPEKREKLMWFYDKMCHVAREYRKSEV
ncbi:hypothetical protein EV294_101345 [Paenibacillus sp. BK033]|uniref:hypothetical protein n=1 Tax=Paenibacillus sp. BK033 TaxID=2512133 RepID=UPI0010512349|nr:hypothetical protein [Paenibacillus sp. BK033]TCN00895.1 hypothetical protein EV294_101345 [Paenibacillus sp. BK033]